ncbi:hypothetical protein K440DRAFT_657294 [Wilcoxina mikolae CBS 423.85]|nr:hypothetical protein K440DRAFT_657294 [Wilcoxina mikolae CBS 423.85]
MSTPRYLVYNKLVVESQKGEGPSEPPPLAPGQMQLFSFWTPSLHAGSYTITATHTVHVSKDTKEDPIQVLKQDFKVIAPQFTIDPKDIHSTYPPQGHADKPDILPHIVFSDPHLPWERVAVKDEHEFGDSEDNQVPWMALLNFDPNGEKQELRLLGPEIVELGHTLHGDGGKIEQGPTLTVKMTVGQYLALGKKDAEPLGHGIEVAIPFKPDDKDIDEKDKMIVIDVVFVSAGLFSELFSSQPPKEDAVKPPVLTAATTTEDIKTSPQSLETKPTEAVPGMPETSSTSAEATPPASKPKRKPNQPDVGRYRYLSHVRNINTIGTTTSGTGIDEHKPFSIIHSHRSGPFDVKHGTPPRAQCVHLLSIEHIHDNMAVLPTSGYVALISLHSWTYLCQPPSSVNFVDNMRTIGKQINSFSLLGIDGVGATRLENCMLRPPLQMMETLGTEIKKLGDKDPLRVAKQRVLNRVMDGYSLVRYRTAAGDETVAFNRGPLVPVSGPVPPISSWTATSNNGQDLQIFDSEIGIMDISYSSAWHLGKTLAIADGAFVGALLRVRRTIFEPAATQTKAEVGKVVRGLHASSDELFNNLDSLKTGLSKLSSNPTNDDDPGKRWSASAPSSVQNPVFTTQNPVIKAALQNGVEKHTGLATEAVVDDDKKRKPYTELNKAKSPDWALIHAWILDRLYLSAIPTQYLITDPSHLPAESIRFFHIDGNWMDCFIDGALSCANHLSRTDDLVRQELKRRFNLYLKTPFNIGAVTHFPQVPIYGFFLRSKVVSAFPDLRVAAAFTDGSNPGTRSEVLVQKNMGSDVLLCLFDRTPDRGQLKSIKISQPPHQRRFSAGSFLNENIIEFQFRGMMEHGETWTLLVDGKTYERPGPTRGVEEPFIFNWNSRCLNMEVFRQELSGAQTEFEKNPTNPALNHPRFTSAFVGVQLNDTVEYLEILKPLNTPISVPEPRELWVPAPLPKPSLTVQTLYDGQQKFAKEQPNIIDIPSVPPPQPGANFPPSVPATTAVSTVSRFGNRKIIALPDDGSKIQPVFATAGFEPTLPFPPGFRLNLTQTQFKFAVYPYGSQAVTNPRDSFAYVDSPFETDLIFALNLGSDPVTNPGLYLHSVEVRIPLAIGSNALSGLMKTVQGKARMLNNQRWVVHISYLANNTLVCQVTPRSLQRCFPLMWNRNLSFRLEGCEIDGDERTVNTTVREVYWQAKQVGEKKWQWLDAGTQENTRTRVQCKKLPAGERSKLLSGIV